ncbi:hypothetical protein GCM10009765_37590 [Fodinicola feengrottensis]|uniref:Uncharacterized protein n=2 Tax=Fodinicola feengrottensis TaxID=435914 RepID=A0ABN2HAQ8_9ACTN
MASYFWDDGSGLSGDTGNPAGGQGMHKGIFASPSWPLGTQGYVLYNGRRADFMIGDRGPGFPSDHGIMLDIDGETYAQLTGGHWNTETHLVDGFGPGHIQVTYVITEWGTGTGVKGLPEPFSTGAWRVHDSRPNLPAPTVVPPVTGPAKSQSLVEHTVVADANTSAVVGVASHHALVADPVVAPASVVSAMVGIGAAAMFVRIRRPGGIAAPAGKHRHTTGRHRRGAMTIGFRPAFAM